MSDAPPTPFRVLFVDDDRAFLDAVAQAFETVEGSAWQLVTTTDAGSVASLLKREPVDLIVLDVAMPDISGLQLLGILNRDHPSVPKVFLAGTINEAERVAGLEGGAELFLEKPPDLAGLRSIHATLNELLKWRRKQGTQASPNRASVLDLVKLECTGGNSRIFEVTSSEAKGVIYIKDGSIIHAECPGRRGQSAFTFLTTRLDAAFNLRQFTEPTERSIYRQWEFLYLEAVQLREQVAQAAVEARAKAAAQLASPPAPEPAVAPAPTEVPAAPASAAPVPATPEAPAGAVPRVTDEDATRQLFQRRQPAAPASPAPTPSAGTTDTRFTYAPTAPAAEVAPAPEPPASAAPAAPRRPAVPEVVPQLRMVGSGSPGSAASAAEPAMPPVAPPDNAPQILEMLVCTNQQEVLYEMNCVGVQGRMRFIELARERSERISQHLPVGNIDRVELQAADGRLVVQFQDDGSVLMRSATAAPQIQPEGSIFHQSMSGWLARHNSIRGLLAAGVIRPGQAAVSQSTSTEFPREPLSVAWRCVVDLFEAASKEGFDAWQLRWLHENAQLYTVRRQDIKALAMFLARDPAQLDSNAIERMFSDFRILDAV